VTHGDGVSRDTSSSSSLRCWAAQGPDLRSDARHQGSFQRSRDVGCYLGLRPKLSQSGDRNPQLGITKAGNIYLRTLLVECANHVLGPHGRDSTLRQWGLHLASLGGKQSRDRAIVAVAGKLAVQLHRIWITQEPYIRSMEYQPEEGDHV
jgi:hypothetical protein